MSLISCQNATVKLGKKTVVKDASLQVSAGELVGLIGPNGAGKSTLLAALAGVHSPGTGSVQLQGQALLEYPPEQRARALAWLAQSGPINWPLTVERLVALGRTPHRSSWQQASSEDETVIERVLAETDCQTLRDRIANTLSGGERARVLLARALAGEPTVLLADEPIAALDFSHQLQTMELLRNFACDHRGCLVVLHDLSLAARYCDRLILMNKGQVVRTGVPQDVLSKDTLRTIYEVEAEITLGEYPSVLAKHRV